MDCRSHESTGEEVPFMGALTNDVYEPLARIACGRVDYFSTCPSALNILSSYVEM